MEPYLFMDEGGVVLSDGLPPIVRNAPVAIVSVAEKVRSPIHSDSMLPACFML